MMNDKYTRVERSFGSFHRSIRLPKDVNQDKVAAKHDNGVLTLVLPKKPVADEPPAKSINIE